MSENNKTWDVVHCIGDLCAQLAPALNQAQNRELGLGEEFTGRIATQIFTAGEYLIKIRRDLSGDRESLINEVQSRLDYEKRIQIHHPQKSWFVAATESGMIAGNICPLIDPIHQLLADIENVAIEDAFYYLHNIFSISIAVMAGHQCNLDIACSNFGVDRKDKKVYYLDDDFYRGGSDDYNMLSESLSTIIRNIHLCDAAFWDSLGVAVRELTDEHFGLYSVSKISYAISEPPLIRPEDIESRNAFLKGFIRKKVPKKQHQNKPQVHKKINVGRKEGEPKIALLSDIHANLSALDAVLEQLEKHNIIKIVITGDIVGYGPDPAECIDRIMQLENTQIIQGNHDHGVSTLNEEQVIDQFNGTPRDVLLWTKNVLEEKHFMWLRDLPKEIKNDDSLIVHGSPKDPHKFFAYVYVMTFKDNLDTLQNDRIHRCFHGHTHVQGVYVRRGKKDIHVTEDGVSLEKDDYALVNPGSVGQPRCGRPGADYALISEDLNVVEFCHTDYDKTGVIQRLENAGLPKNLQTRLTSGR